METVAEWSEFAWAVGLFEGEGSISAQNGERYSLGLHLCTTDGDVIHRFHRAIGVGNVTGPHAHHQPRRKPTWRWTVTGDKALPILDAMIPRLGDRRRARAEEVVQGRRAYLADATKPRVCQECGETFEMERWNHNARRKYCSKKCGAAWQYREGKEARRITTNKRNARKRAMRLAALPDQC